MPFEPGQSGNPGGRPRTKLFAEALRLQVLRMQSDGTALPEKPRQIDLLANMLLQEALAGTNRIQAIKEIRDTLDGKPAQSIEHSGHIARTHEEELAALENPDIDDTSREEDSPPAA